MILHGRNIVVYSGSTAIAAARSCKVSISTDKLERRSLTSGQYRLFSPGRYTWAVSVDQLVTSVANRFDDFGEQVRLNVYVRNENGTLSTARLTGYAYIERSELTATRGDMARGSVVFRGTGKIEWRYEQPIG